MARVANPYYIDQSDPYPTNGQWATAGQSLGTALFGDPNMRAMQQLRQSQMQNYNAEALDHQAAAALAAENLHGAQAKDTALAGLGGDFASLYTRPTPAAPQAPVLDSGAPAPADPTGAVNPMAAPAPASPPPAAAPAQAGGPPTVDQGALATLVGHLILAGRPDVAKDIAGFTAYSGSNPIERSTLISQGVNPSADFAVNGTEAANIAATAAAAAKDKDVAVANTTGGYTLGAAKIHAAAEQAVGGAQAAAERYGADQRLQGEKYLADRRLEGVDDRVQALPTRTHVLSPSQSANMGNDISAALGVSGKPDPLASQPDLDNAVKAETGQLYGQSGNYPAALSQAIADLVQINHSGIAGTGYGPGVTYAPKRPARSQFRRCRYG